MNMKVLDLITGGNKTSIKIDRSTIALGTYPDQVNVPIVNLLEGTKYLSEARPVMVGSQLVLDAAKQDESVRTDFCLARFRIFVNSLEGLPQELFTEDSSVTILASSFEPFGSNAGQYDLLCKFPIGRVIRVDRANLQKRLFITEQFVAQQGDEIGQPFSAEDLEALSQAIRSGETTPA